MSRPEKEFRAAARAEIEPRDWLRLLIVRGEAAGSARARAIARLLSGERLDRASSAEVGGAFARSERETWLIEGKDK